MGDGLGKNPQFVSGNVFELGEPCRRQAKDEAAKPDTEEGRGNGGKGDFGHSLSLPME